MMNKKVVTFQRVTVCVLIMVLFAFAGSVAGVITIRIIDKRYPNLNNAWVNFILKEAELKGFFEIDSPYKIIQIDWAERYPFETEDVVQTVPQPEVRHSLLKTAAVFMGKIRDRISRYTGEYIPFRKRYKYEANADTNAYTDAEKSKLNGIAAGAQVNAVTSVASKTGAVTLAKADVGLGSVDNTADASKVVASAAKLTTARTLDGVSFDGSAAITHYGTCATAAATAAKTVALTSFTLVTGAEVTVMFGLTNTAASPTLNVNGTGAKAIYYRNAAITAGYLAANRVYKFVYDGTQYELIGDINVDTNTTYAVATASANGLMSAADKTKLDTMKARTAVLSGGDPTMALAAYE